MTAFEYEFANNKAKYAFNGQTINLNGNAVFVEILDEYDDNSGLVGVPAIVNAKKQSILSLKLSVRP